MPGAWPTAAGSTSCRVGYRLAPEHPFPAAVDDADDGDGLGPRARSATSAAGRRSRSAVIPPGAAWPPSCANRPVAPVCFQALVYPCTDARMSGRSYVENATGYSLTSSAMAWFYGHYLSGDDGSPDDPRVSPLLEDDARLASAPSALVVTAEYDPLRDDGVAYAGRLADAGVATSHVHVDGQIHGFFSMFGLLDDCRSTQALVAEAVATAFAKPPPTRRRSGHPCGDPDGPTGEAMARSKMASSIGGVSRPVKVFCCDGWNEASSVGPPSSATSTPWPKRGRGRTPYTRQAAANPKAPRHTTTAGSSAASSRRANGSQASRSCGVGALAGGAHLTDAVTHTSAQLEPVADVRRRRLVGQPDAVHGGEQEVAAAVAGEDPPGAVGAVGGRGQAEHDDARRRVAEAGHRPAPVGLVAVGGPALDGDLLAPRDQARTGAAADDLVGHRGQGGQARAAHAAYSGSPGAPGLQWASDGSPNAPDCSK